MWVTGLSVPIVTADPFTPVVFIGIPHVCSVYPAGKATSDTSNVIIIILIIMIVIILVLLYVSPHLAA